AVRTVCIDVAAVEEVPVGGADVAAGTALERDARCRDATPLLADLLALVVIERGEVVVEVAPAAIRPVELHAGARDHAGARRRRSVGAGGEQDVQRREATDLQNLERARDERI